MLKNSHVAAIFYRLYMLMMNNTFVYLWQVKNVSNHQSASHENELKFFLESLSKYRNVIE